MAPSPSLLERWQQSLQNKPIVAAAIIAATALGGVATFTDKLSAIRNAFFKPAPSASAAPPPTVQVNPSINVNPTVTVNPTVNVNPNIILQGRTNEAQKSEQLKMALDRGASILRQMQADNDRVRDAIADRNSKRSGRQVPPEWREMARSEVEYSSEFQDFSKRYDETLQQFKSLLSSYADAIGNDEITRAAALRNQIHELQLQFQLEVLIAESDGGRNLTQELSSRITDQFAARQFKSDPIPTDPVVKDLLSEVQRVADVSAADAANLPTVETATPGSLARVSGECRLLRPGSEPNDRSVMVLGTSSGGSNGNVAWFEWGWQDQLSKACQPGNALTVVGIMVGDSNGVKVLRAAALPGQQQQPFRYRDPHGGDKLLRYAEPSAAQKH